MTGHRGRGYRTEDDSGDVTLTEGSTWLSRWEGRVNQDLVHIFCLVKLGLGPVRLGFVPTTDLSPPPTRRSPPSGPGSGTRRLTGGAPDRSERLGPDTPTGPRGTSDSSSAGAVMPVTPTTGPVPVRVPSRVAGQP